MNLTLGRDHKRKLFVGWIAMNYKHAFLILALMLATQLFHASTAEACKCGPKPTILQSYEKANIVVVVQVVSVDKSQAGEKPETGRVINGVHSTRMIVEKVFKGDLKPGEEMIFGQGTGADCIYGFSENSIGDRYLFYLPNRPKEERLWYAGYCGRSEETKFAADDLLYLENKATVRGRTRLSGTLNYYQSAVIEGEESIHNLLEGIKIKIIGDKQTYECTTNRDGVYEIYDLPAGNYVIEPQVPGGLKISFQSASAFARDSEETRTTPKSNPSIQVILETGKHAFHDFGYGVNNAIRGHVFDPLGNAMKDVCLRLLPAEGRPLQNYLLFACTKKDGAFELTGLPPGRYILTVNEIGKFSSSQPFTTFYYPKELERAKAGIISITAGQTIEDVDVYVPKLLERVTIEGVLLHSDNKPVVDGVVSFEGKGPSDEVDGKAQARTDNTGRFEIQILKGVEGSIYGEASAYSRMYENCPKIEEFLRQNMRGLKGIRTNVVAIRAQENVSGVELKFPFPSCTKAH